MQGPLSDFVNQAADTFDGNGDSFRAALRELSQTAGRLGDSRTDLFGTLRNLQVLINALSNSNEQIVQFSDHVASVSQVLADSSTDLDNTLGTLNTALSDVRGFLKDSNEALIDQVNKLAGFTSILTEHSDDIEQILHITPNGLANFYNIYDPAQGTVGGLLTLPNFANPVQFICGGVFDAGTSTDNYKRAEICRQRMGPVLRRITVNFPPFLFHPINSITAYKGQIIYDTPQTEAKAETPVPYLKWQPGVTPPPASADTDLSSLMVPPAASTSHAGGPEAAPAVRMFRRPLRRFQQRRWGMSWLPRTKASRAAQRSGGYRRRHRAAGRVLVRWVELAQHARHGRAPAGLLQDHDSATRRRHPAAELPGDGRRRHRGKRVGNRRGSASGRHVQCGRTAVAGPERQAARECHGQGCADLTAGFPACRFGRAGRPEGRRSAQGRLTDSAGPHRSIPTTEEVLSSLGVVVNKGNLAALQDITDETYNAVAGRQGSFTDLVPRLAELTTSLDQQTNDIITAAEGLNRFAGILARSKDNSVARSTRCPPRSTC